MPLEKKEKLTPIQRLRRIILGREKPNRITRISVGIGFLIWVYLFSWPLLTSMALHLMDSLDHAEVIKGAYYQIGKRNYRWDNEVILLLKIHNYVQLTCYFITLFGLILIYRKKRIGFLVYVLGNLLIVLSTILILKLKYFQFETSYTYVALMIGTTLYFSIGAVWFYKIKPQKEYVDNTK